VLKSPLPRNLQNQNLIPVAAQKNHLAARPKNLALKKRRKSRQGRISSSAERNTISGAQRRKLAVEALCERLRGAKPAVTDSRYRKIRAAARINFRERVSVLA
jgi:hypothetical protein